jgi:aspartyl-tRNA(Asn)/glutamyl-tRNA(Gln) amidotransferase subunit A
MTLPSKFVASSEEKGLHTLAATELVDRYRRRLLSPVDVAAAVLERIRETGAINAFASVNETTLLEDAHASEARWKRNAPLGPVDGIPISVKDLLDVRGFPTRKGSRTTPDAPAAKDCPAAERLRESGALLLGKTTTSEFGLKGLGDNPLNGTTRNPWDLSRSPGGSSAGAVAAVAAGIGPIAIGTDGGGSIRVPAAWTGVVGFKPTFGRIPTSPSTVAGTPPVVGPVARNIADIALVMSVLSAPDSRDPVRLPPGPLDHQRTLDYPLADVAIGAVSLDAMMVVDPDVAQAFARALEIFRQLGAEVDLLRPLPASDSALRTFFQARAAHTIRNLSEVQRGLLDPTILEAARAGEKLSALDFLAAEEERTRLAGDIALIQNHHDLILTPTVAAPAPPADGSVDPHWPSSAPRSPFAGLFSLTRQPAVSIPMGLSSRGLPLGLQIAGRPFDGALVLRAARSFELRRDPLVSLR